MSNPMPDTESTALVPIIDTPLPVFNGAQMVEAFKSYQQLQQALDHAMPDQIMSIEGRKFRKKGYWRALAVAFNLTVEVVTEAREADGIFGDGQENFGYRVTYRALARNGRAVVGDGSCFAIEKARRDEAWKVRPRQATEHNVRSHAHTRAFNRAVSNLVGFGEVSAEEINDDEPPRPRPAPVKTPQNSRPDATPDPRPATQTTITDAQGKKLWAVARRHGWDEPALRAWLVDLWNCDSIHKVKRQNFDTILEQLAMPRSDEAGA